MTGTGSTSSSVIEVATGQGPGRLLVAGPDPTAPGAPTVLLGHGAGGQLDALDLAALAHHLPSRGIRVVRFEQPWRTAGGRITVASARLDAAWLDAVAQVRQRWSGILITGGRSTGARVACRTAAAAGAVGVVCLAFPLHHPDRPASTRADELTMPQVPTLVCQGSRDVYGDADRVAREVTAVERIEVLPILGADHQMRVRRSDPWDDRTVAAAISTAVTRFVNDLLDRSQPGRRERGNNVAPERVVPT